MMSNKQHNRFFSSAAAVSKALLLFSTLCVPLLSGASGTVEDRFNRPNTGAVSAGTVPNPIGSQYVIEDGIWEIGGNIHLQASAGGIMYDSSLQTLRTGANSFRLKVNVLHPNYTKSQATRHAGIILNAQDPDNYYLIRWGNQTDGDLGNIQIVKRSNGTNQQIGDRITGLDMPGGWYEWTFASSPKDGDEIVFSVTKAGSSSPIYSGSFKDTSFSDGHAGFYRTGSGTVRFDDYSLAASGEPLRASGLVVSVLSRTGVDPSAKKELGFRLADISGRSPQVRDAFVDKENKRVVIDVFPGVPLNPLALQVSLPDDCTVSPAADTRQDFSSPVTYTVKTAEGSEKWTVELREAIPAFPGALGAGRYSRGGRGGDVFHVTSLECEGPGTFREGLASANGPRTIVFDVGGTIHLKKPLFIDKSFLTIAGQTAPGGGITIRTDHGNRGLYFIWEFLKKGVPSPFPEDVIIQHVRVVHHTAPLDDEFKVSPNTNPEKGAPFRSGGNQSLRIDEAKNVLLDHVSVRGGARNNLCMSAPDNNTLQYLFNVEPNGRKFGGWMAGGTATKAFNLEAHFYGRPFKQGNNGRYDLVNNMVYNVAARGSGLGYATVHRDTLVNFEGNIFIDGPGPGVNGSWPVDHTRPAFPPENAFDLEQGVQAFIQGNVWDRNYDYKKLPGDQAPFSPESCDSLGNPAGKGQVGDQPVDVMWSGQRTAPVSARQAYINILSWGGASAKRDVHDRRIVHEIMNKDGGWRNLPEDVPGGAFPALDRGEPVVCTARDGIADPWKMQHGLDTGKAYHQVVTDDGYTWLEKYLHWLVRDTFPPEPGETGAVEIAAASSGAVAVICWPEGPAERNWIGEANGIHQYLLLRFNVSSVKPGRVKDGYLKLPVAGLSGEAAEMDVYGLRHDSSALRWNPDTVKVSAAPGLEVQGDRPQPRLEELVRIGRLQVSDSASGMAVMDNPNLPVFLNLAAYSRDSQSGNDEVTLLLIPRKGKVLIPDGGIGSYSPVLVLDAVASGK